MGALFAQQVEGRVSTEVMFLTCLSLLLVSDAVSRLIANLPCATQVDPRLAYDTGRPYFAVSPLQEMFSLLTQS